MIQLFSNMISCNYIAVLSYAIIIFFTAFVWAHKDLYISQYNLHI